MSRINSNLIYIWNAFRNLNAIKADKGTTPELTPKVTPEVAPETASYDDVELGARRTAWPGQCSKFNPYTTGLVRFK
ncbi:MAG: hypothetical protein CMM15_05025 [Rhodospirillaceae bacterium]|nr:hypothetical protein [Rhodospirillaceae bacterium]|tara:strand:- start:1193 stop:1423 length:231 start_codon:yes stop_codon:yes gene_type:complete